MSIEIKELTIKTELATAKRPHVSNRSDEAEKRLLRKVEKSCEYLIRKINASGDR